VANSDKELEELLRPKVPPKGYLFLLIGIVMFSGIFARATGPIRVLDYTTILGEFGTIAKDAGAGFRGKGGVGVREGFVFAFTALPAVALAIGLINIIEGQGGLKAAQRLLNPILKPLLGIPGWTGLALMGNLQNTDTGAVLTRSLLDRNLITDNELSIFSAFQLPASAIIGMYFSTGVLLFPYFPAEKALILPFSVGLVMKFVGANLMRLYLSMATKKGAKK
jgi:nucleoside recognition membrane protein YjiH